MATACAASNAVNANTAGGCSPCQSLSAALPGCPDVPGPARFVAPFLFALQELLQAAAARGGRLGTGALLVGLAGLGPVAGGASEQGQFALELLEPSALLIALVLKKQVAAIGAEL